MKKFSLLSFLLVPTAVLAADPAIVSTTVCNVGSKGEIAYTLQSAPAVVTMDIQTNSPSGWLSIGGKYFANATGDVNCRVEKTSGRIVWRARQNWKDHEIGGKGFRAVISAWSVDNPPPYMVLDLRKTSDGRVKYYAKESDLVGGGVLADDMYRTTHLVLKKITAKGIPWTMGSVYEQVRAADETLHTVVLDKDYYMGVFEVTQYQHALAGETASWAKPVYGVDGDMRPADTAVSYNLLRGDASGTTETLVEPKTGSIIGKFRSRTGVDLDLPTEAQWEYAARGGYGEGYWPEGSPQMISGWDDSSLKCYVSPTLAYIGRYRGNGGAKNKEHYGENCYVFWTEDMVGPTNATAKVGTYVPNAYGLYDTCGNMREWCLDWYKADITGLNGAPVMERGDGAELRVTRGGSYRDHGGKCRPARRGGEVPSRSHEGWNNPDGYRLCAPCIAK